MSDTDRQDEHTKGPTPGPWVVEKAVKYIGHAPIFSIWSDGVEIADVCNSRPEAIVSANAHLIAAAPDLLEACRETESVLIQLDNSLWPRTPNQWELLDQAHRLLRAAIARAEGREGGERR